jgi:2-C-methyl-D-erythritol 4-phosphate cytidylyltransferase
MGKIVPKQFLPLLGKPVIYYSIRSFLEAFEDIRIILVLPTSHLSQAETILQSFEVPPGIVIVEGGGTRFQSVQNGLKKIQEEEVIFVHDGVRPLVSVSLIHACYKQAVEKGSAIPAVEAKESLRESLTHGNTRAVDRTKFRVIQTPQTFRTNLLLQAFSQPYNPLFTDEASVVEHSGIPVHLIEGDERNIKITRPVDLVIAEELLKAGI